MSGQTDPKLVEVLRTMARDGRMPSEMFAAIKGRLGTACHILDIIRYFRAAFGLTLAEAKPLACVSGYPSDAGREIVDVPRLDSLIQPAIAARAPVWGAVAVTLDAGPPAAAGPGRE